uniref:DUF4216 domain-containing protein n=1 Tax=Setaria viridis TaxID=4556 RepID=A0A4U6TL48_SETVI|nr:hypothetical protein SEVIR_7G009200v2 [Setaria viridis]
MTWYGVIRRMISLEFPAHKEVGLFHCDWYDVLAASTSRSRGYSREKYGVIDIDTSRPNEDLSNWTRSDKEGTTGDASVLNQVRAGAVLELDDAVLLDEDDDDEDGTYIDDGVVAPVVVESLEDDFFV